MLTSTLVAFKVSPKLLDSHPSQQHTGLLQSVFQLKQEVHWPKTWFKPTQSELSGAYLSWSECFTCNPLCNLGCNLCCLKRMAVQTVWNNLADVAQLEEPLLTTTEDLGSKPGIRPIFIKKIDLLITVEKREGMAD